MHDINLMLTVFTGIILVVMCLYQHIAICDRQKKHDEIKGLIERLGKEMAGEKEG